MIGDLLNWLLLSWLPLIVDLIALNGDVLNWLLLNGDLLIWFLFPWLLSNGDLIPPSTMTLSTLLDDWFLLWSLVLIVTLNLFVF